MDGRRAPASAVTGGHTLPFKKGHIWSANFKTVWGGRTKRRIQSPTGPGSEHWGRGGGTRIAVNHSL
jgi:hypothetical protein